MVNNRPTPDVISAPDSDCHGEIRHGSVVIAAITSCTNTSNPSVMLAAGLLAGAEMFVTHERLVHREGRMLDGEHRLDVAALWPDKAVALVCLVPFPVS